MSIVISHHIVGSDGLTDRERNMQISHKFAVGSLVEIQDGVRMFVAMHTRDCDGTPLYSLTAFKEDFDDIEWSYQHRRLDWISGISEENMMEVLG